MEYKEEDIKVITADASKLITPKPCWLFLINWGLTQGAENRYKLYNGRGTDGELFFDVQAGKTGSFTVVGIIPIFFSQGLYCEFVTNGNFTTFQVLEEY